MTCIVKPINLFLIFVSFIMCHPIGAKAQSTSPDVIATSGDYFSNANYSVAWTLGETMGETYSQATNFLTQGFNQPDYGTLTFAENPNSGTSIIAFPNPVINDLTISFESNNKFYLVKVFDAIGNLIKIETITANINSVYKIPFSSYSSGVYLVQIINNNTFSKTSYTIIKVGE